MTYQVQASIPMYTQLPEDVITNTFHYDWVAAGTPTTTDFESLGDAIAGFYETLYITGSTYGLSAYLRPALYREKIYDLTDPIPRAPVLDRVNPLTVKQSVVGTPNEVALCLSYHAAVASGLNQASRRGRIYLGGFDTACWDPGNTTIFPRPVQGFCDRIILAAKQQLLTAAAGDGWAWVVHSTKLNSSAVVTGGWVDNSLDTQRRRGVPTTVRNLWSA